MVSLYASCGSQLTSRVLELRREALECVSVHKPLLSLSSIKPGNCDVSASCQVKAMIPRRIPFNQIAFATLVGVGGGIYIYRPMFESHRRNTSEGKKAEAENKGQNNMDK